jgi:hypothetical protein
VTVFFHDTVYRLRPASKTSRSGETGVPDYSTLAAAPIDGSDARVLKWSNVQVRPESQAETDTEDRSTSVSQWFIATASGAPDFDVKAGDWIRLADGSITVLIGDPARPSDPVNGGLDHIQIRVQRTAG